MQKNDLINQKGNDVKVASISNQSERRWLYLLVGGGVILLTIFIFVVRNWREPAHELIEVPMVTDEEKTKVDSEEAEELKIVENF